MISDISSGMIPDCQLCFQVLPHWSRNTWGEPGIFSHVSMMQSQRARMFRTEKATFYTLFVTLNIQCVGYRIALNFRGPKFSRIAISLKHNSRIRCTHTPHSACQKFSLKCFRKRLKICKIHEIKDPQKFCAIRYLLLAKQISLQKRPFCDSAL